MPLAAMTTAPRIRILKFTSPTCAVCNDLQKKGFYEDLKLEFPKVAVESFDLSQDGMEKLADLYEVKSVPTFVFEVEHYGAVETIEGAGTKAQTLKLFSKALKACEEVAGAVRETGAVAW